MLTPPPRSPPRQPAGTNSPAPGPSRRSANSKISRSWLYTQPDIRDQIQHQRDTTTRTPAAAIPARQRATDASLRSRLTTALERNRVLTEENARLRRQLARALGDERSARPQPRNDQHS